MLPYVSTFHHKFGLVTLHLLLFLNRLITSLFFFVLYFSLNFCKRFYDKNIVVSLRQIYLLNFILFYCIIHRMWGEGWKLLSTSAKSMTFMGCLVPSLSCLIVMKDFLPQLKLLLETGKICFFFSLELYVIVIYFPS